MNFSKTEETTNKKQKYIIITVRVVMIILFFISLLLVRKSKLEERSEWSKTRLYIGSGCEIIPATFDANMKDAAVFDIIKNDKSIRFDIYTTSKNTVLYEDPFLDTKMRKLQDEKMIYVCNTYCDGTVAQGYAEIDYVGTTFYVKTENLVPVTYEEFYEYIDKNSKTYKEIEEMIERRKREQNEK